MSEQAPTKDLSSWPEVEAETGWSPGARSNMDIAAAAGWKALREISSYELHRRIGEQALRDLLRYYNRE